MLLGGLTPLVLLLLLPNAFGLSLAALCALVGLLAYEHAYVQAGPSRAPSLRSLMRPKDLKALGDSLRDKLKSRPRRLISDNLPKYASPKSQPSHFPGPSEIGLDTFPASDRWEDWQEYDSRSWPKKVVKHYQLIPTICFNCEAACGLLAYVDKESHQVRKLEGNPLHPGSRVVTVPRVATRNQLVDPDHILYPLKRSGQRGEGKWQRVSWDEALADIAARIRSDISQTGGKGIVYHVGRLRKDGFTNRVLQAWGIDGHNSHTNICSSNARERVIPFGWGVIVSL
ncbi:MAG: molybdopterin-dependent oxidoreductase [Deinococcales bacterium]